MHVSLLDRSRTRSGHSDGDALAATIERSTSQRERARNLDARIDLIREIHEQVIQRLFGLSLALGSDEPLTGEERRRFRDELQVVLSELRTALGRRLGPERPPTSTTLREMLEHRALASAVRLDWSEGTVTPEHLEPLAQSVAIEALRNAEHHSDGGPVDVSVATEGDTFVLSVVNGGARTDRPGGGLGLRLLTLEALQHDGLVEFGPFGEDGWRVRLLAPVDER